MRLSTTSAVRSLGLLGLAAFLSTAAPQASADPACPNEAIRVEQHSTSLPDCRAYEMVSPPDKNGGDVIARPSRTRAAVDGEAAAFASLISFADAHGTSLSSEFIAKRNGLAGTPGWATHAILPKLDPFSPNGISAGVFRTNYMGEFSPDLSKGILMTATNLSGDPNLAGVANLYLREDVLSPGVGTYSTVSACPVCSGPFTKAQQLENVEVGGSTPDLGQIVFETKKNLTADASGEGSKVYEFDHGVLRLVSILPQSEGGAMAASAITGTGAKEGNFSPHVISDDGRRIFFTAVSSGTSGTLYMRVDGIETVRISGAQPAQYETASADGTKVFFTEAEQLKTYDADAGEGEHVTLIGVTGDLAGVMGASADGGFVYLISKNKLIAGQPGFNGIGFYVWHAGVIRFIGSSNSIVTDLGENKLPANLGTPLGSRVSPDGRTLLFTSHSGSGLGGYQQNGPGCGVIGCGELYSYSFDTDLVTCASCNPSGTPATAGASIIAEAGSGAAGPTSHLGRPLSDDGRFVFFTSDESLLSEDTNGVSDAYSYDAATGQVSLLSSGASSDGSYFLDATPSGSDVFFATREPLVGWDVDGAVDLYDARVGGGFPEPLPSPAACAGDGCQGPSPGAAGQPSAASATFVGPGDVKPQRKHKKHKKKHRKRKSKQRTATSKRGGVK